MLPKAERLTTDDFKGLRGGRMVHTPHFFLRLTPVLAGREKAAVIVSSSVYKRATDRNLLRRRMYHALRKHWALFTGFIVTVTMKKGALSATFSELALELQNTPLKGR